MPQDTKHQLYHFYRKHAEQVTLTAERNNSLNLWFDAASKWEQAFQYCKLGPFRLELERSFFMNCYRRWSDKQKAKSKRVELDRAQGGL